MLRILIPILACLVSEYRALWCPWIPILTSADFVQEDMEKIIKAVCTEGSESSENKHQTLLFSATVPSWVQQVARKYLRPDNKETVDLVTGQAVATATKIQHLSVASGWTTRAATIGSIVNCYAGAHGRTIIFTETKKEADELARDTGIKVVCGVLHGDVAQAQREIVFQGFRDGTVQVSA
jgi:ATP-dependent RNA helicase DDX21